MTFEEHLERHRNPDGSFNLAAAQKALYEELRSDPDVLDELAQKAASSDRRAWESSNRERLNAQFKAGQGSFSLADIDLEAKVPLGDSVVVSLGDMNDVRIRLRKDLRTKAHLDEIEAFDREMKFWFATEALLPPGGTIGEIGFGAS